MSKKKKRAEALKVSWRRNTGRRKRIDFIEGRKARRKIFIDD